MIEVHVVPHGNAWALEVDGNQQESFGTRYEAIRCGRELAEQEQGKLVIHGEDGQIGEKDSRGKTRVTFPVSRAPGAWRPARAAPARKARWAGPHSRSPDGPSL
jgi:hypothetical protein